MKKIRKTLVAFILLLLLLTINIMKLEASEQLLQSYDVPNANKMINLKTKGILLSLALQKIAKKGNFNIAIAPGFNDGIVTVNFSKTTINDALSNLMSIGGFILEDNNSIIIARSIKEEEYINDIVPLQYAQASRAAFVLDNTIEKDDNNMLSYDDVSNVVMVKGDKEYVSKVKELASKIDLPKKHSTFKLNHYTSTQVSKIIKEMAFGDSLTLQENKTDDSKSLKPVLDDNLNYVIKCMVQKQESLSIKGENPLVIPEETNNELTIIGNSHQIELSKEIIEYLEGKKIDKDEEIRQAHNKLYKTRQQLDTTKSKLHEAELILADAAISQVEKEIELNAAKKQIKELNQQVNSLKSKQLWNILVHKPSQEQQSDVIKLENEILQLKKELNETREKLTLNNNNDIEERLIQKNEELELAYNQISNIKAQLAELKLKESFNDNESSVSDNGQNMVLMSSAIEELSTTKKELALVKQQLETSKKQLELIFGGKLLDKDVVPDDKSLWFK